MAEKLSIKGIALAFAVLIAIAYIICFVIILVAGNASLKFFQLFIHGIDLTSLATTPNIGLGILGLIIITAISYIFGAIFALIYNKFAE